MPADGNQGPGSVVLDGSLRVPSGNDEQFAVENGHSMPFIVSFPIKSGDFPIKGGDFP